MIDLLESDKYFCLRRMPHVVKKAMTKFPGKISVGGGFIRSCITGDKINDIDLFTADDDTTEKCVDFLKLELEIKKPWKTHNAYTFKRSGKPPIQLIHRWRYIEPVDVLKDLDFSICCAVIWAEGIKPETHDAKPSYVWHGSCCNSYYMDLAAKRLRYMAPNRIEEYGGSMLRILKYYQKGYKISLQSLGAVIARACHGVNHPDSGKNSVRGFQDEEQLAKVLTGLLVEVDPNAVQETVVGE